MDVTAGWFTGGPAGAIDGLQFRLVDAGGTVVPSHFRMAIQPPEPTGAMINLYCEIVEGVVTVPMILAMGVDATSAGDVLRKEAPIGAWAAHAVSFLSVRMLLEQLKRQADIPMLAKLLGKTPEETREDLKASPGGPFAYSSGFSEEELNKLYSDPRWESAAATLRNDYAGWGVVPTPSVLPVRPTRRRNAMTKQHLREVAKVYRRALKDEGTPTKAVAEHFNVSHSTAARWVGTARTEGVLGPAKRGHAGETADKQ